MGELSLRPRATTKLNKQLKARGLNAFIKDTKAFPLWKISLPQFPYIED